MFSTYILFKVQTQNSWVDHVSIYISMLIDQIYNTEYLIFKINGPRRHGKNIPNGIFKSETQKFLFLCIKYDIIPLPSKPLTLDKDWSCGW